MKQTVLLFGGLILALLVLFQVGRYSVFRSDFRMELMIGVTALVFLGLGWLLRRRQPLVQAERPTTVDREKVLLEAGITSREYEVLEHIAAGLSNREIAAALYLSESTVKTHVSNLLSKLDAKRRTQAVERARMLKIL